MPKQSGRMSRRGFKELGTGSFLGGCLCERAVPEKDFLRQLEVAEWETFTAKLVRVYRGGAKRPLWRQILADVLDVELVTLHTAEGAAYGAAVLAAVGVGAFSDVASACAEIIRVAGSAVPGPASSTYRRMYPLYRQLYPALRSSFNAIARVTA